MVKTHNYADENVGTIKNRSIRLLIQQQFELIMYRKEQEG
jgi:hypothetical protein